MSEVVVSPRGELWRGAICQLGAVKTKGVCLPLEKRFMSPSDFNVGKRAASKNHGKITKGRSQ
jgi:hypothetical protein